ncbi:signal transduction histidine kinase [Deinococcus metalli]|uniref:histidine kinase n=1 Tax=Deinococcus metalli TaxID=1141878 RepID=A0A7W8KHZ2_9DEIO|nr:ATP-binding protein [Deinococcus metalli]MBB5378475.1 signal transduction histidine kinase [Deinococcus metalli]GHF57992.1 two-component sensor histidine kinase [Deinococcus metalli]
MIANLSLRIKLTLGYALVFAVTVVLGGAGVYFAAERALGASLDATLQETASVARASIERVDGQTAFTPDLNPNADLSIELLRPDGQVIARAGNASEGTRTQFPVTPGLGTEDARRVLTLPVEGLVLRVSRSTEALSGFLETLAKLLLIGSVFMIAAACAAGYWLADRALRPVDAVVRTADAIARRGDYAERVLQAPGNDEMARLTRTVNSMLDGLSHTIEREKNFARTAAHELRTPLTVLRGRLDLTLKRPREAAEYERALLGMRGRVEALQDLTEGLLALARSEAPVALQPVDLAAVAVGASEVFEDTAHAQGKRLALEIEPTEVHAEPDGVARALGNLLENALKYGDGDVIWIRTAARELSVESLGPGPARDDWPRLLLPFERGAGVQSVEGSGLGLALVSALARRWHAQLIPEWTATTFQVHLRFPAT